ncbi:MAG TPA: HAMP domain-containing sensor histidine kinase [Candidatus Limnocylindria bacterium]|nr:HAMP domain-containing sensor histidine kinase [Candidatus Limnocylindria bacterium]
MALVLSAAVLIVLLLAGAVVNRVVTQSFEEVVTEQQAQQVEAAAEALTDLVRVGGEPRSVAEGARILNRLARSLDGSVELIGPDGRPLASFGRPISPDVAIDEIRVPITTATGVEVATLVAQAPTSSGTTDRPFLQLFNASLVVAGLVSVAAIAGVSVWMARRQTKPLQDVAAAATRLGSGDLSARATGGGDLESQELAGAFNSMAGRLESSEMLRRRAATDMAHDLATPATVLQGQLQAMIDGVVPRSKANLEAAAASAAAMGSVIVQMGELASAEAAPLQARPERIDVAAVLAEAASALDGLYRERGVTLKIEPTAPGLAAHADPAHLGRALRNVMTNAAQHTPTGQTVRVTATSATATTDGAPSNRVQIRVTDEGPGIPAEDLPHIFERFYRSDPARSAHPSSSEGSADSAGRGAGIGLTIARELLAPSSGAISVERTGPDGTVLLIELPSA